MDCKDYYAIPGIPSDADEQTIRKAYRKLARQYHPDVNPGDNKAEERFKEINEAYEALGNPERRRKYDQLREQYQCWQQRGGDAKFDWSPWQTAPGQTVYTYTTVSPEDLEDLFGGESPFSDFFGTIFGQPRSAPRGPQRGRDIELPVEISLEEAFHGTTRSLQAGTRRIEAKIPVGVRTGTRVRLAGQGRPGIAGGPPGDLYLLITVLPHPQFERNGDDLTTTVPVDRLMAIAGSEARIPTLDGSVLLKIPSRMQADQVFRLRGKGMPRLERPAERGDLFARVKLVLLDALSDAEVETIRTLMHRRSDRKKHDRRASAVRAITLGSRTAPADGAGICHPDRCGDLLAGYDWRDAVNESSDCIVRPTMFSTKETGTSSRGFIHSTFACAYVTRDAPSACNASIFLRTVARGQVC